MFGPTTVDHLPVQALQAKVIRDQLPEAHCYADDIQLHVSFKPHSDASKTAAVNAMECCIEKIREWMIRDKLMINDSKTEFILI